VATLEGFLANRFTRLALPLAGGAFLALFMSLILQGLKPIWVILLILGIAVVIPTFLARDVRLYWLAIFLFSLQLDVKKNLVDGVRVLDALKIDYMQFVFVPEIRLSDLCLAVLLLLWGVQVYFRRTRHQPVPYFYLILGFFAFAILSMFKAPHLFLSLVELLRQAKFVIIFLYAAQTIDSRKVIKVIFAVLLLSLVVQEVTSVARYRLNFFEPLESLLGVRSFMSAEEREDRLKVDEAAGAGFGFVSARRSFGTLQSPASTTKFALLIFPLALIFAMRTWVFSRRGLLVLIALMGIVMFYLTFSRASFVALIAEIILAYWICVMRGYISRRGALALLYLILLGGFAFYPRLIMYMKSRTEAVYVRLYQYETALQMIRDNPFLGVGLNNGTGVKWEYEGGGSVGADPTARSSEQPIHSFYLSLLAEVGIFGFLCYLGFFAAISRKLHDLSRLARDPFIAMSASALLISVLGLGVAVLVDPLFEDPVLTLLWFYAGITVALARMEARQAAAP